MNSTILSQQFSTYFVKKPGIVVVYLYGSYAKGEEQKESDIDIGILFDSTVYKPFTIRQRMAEELQQELGKTVEIQDLLSCRVDFAYRVIQEGTVIYCRSQEKRVAFEEKIFQQYFDLQPFFAEYYNALKVQIQRGDFHA